MDTVSSLMSNSKEVERISKIIDCPIEIVRHCILQIGPSISAIDMFWQMNKDRLLEEFQMTKG